MSRRTRAYDPRAEAEAQGYDTGSRAIPVVIKNVAVGTRQVIKVAHRVSHLAVMDDVTDAMIKAADILITACEHCEAGKGLGPIDAGADRVQEHRAGDGLGVQLLAQERAITSAARIRRGTQAMGITGSAVVMDVAIVGLPLGVVDKKMRWRNGMGKRVLVAALNALAAEYECA